METHHKTTISATAEKTVSPPALQTPTIQFMQKELKGYININIIKIDVAVFMISGSTLKKNGNSFESGSKRIPTQIPISGINHKEREA